MAAANGSVVDRSCLKCEKEVNVNSEKFLICYYGCNRLLHSQCSQYKPTELKFMDLNAANIRWTCDRCVNKNVKGLCRVEDVGGGDPDRPDRLSNLEDMVRECVKMLKSQAEKLSRQSQIIQKLENQMQVKMAADKPETSSFARVTRSKGTPLDDATKGVVGDGSKLRKEATDGEDSAGLQQSEARQGKHKIRTDNNKDVNIHALDIAVKSAVENVNKDEYKLVRYKRKTIKGVKANTKLTGVEKNRWVFVSRMHPKTTEKDITDYLKENNFDVNDCQKLDIRATGHSAFKFAVPESIMDSLLDGSIWPQNTIVREYRSPYKRPQNTESDGATRIYTLEQCNEERPL